jgi:hypothetical protein
MTLSGPAKLAIIIVGSVVLIACIVAVLVVVLKRKVRSDEPIKVIETTTSENTGTKTKDNAGNIDDLEPTQGEEGLQPPLVDARHFFSLASTDGTVGRDDDGSLWVKGVQVEKGIDTREEALQYALACPLMPLSKDQSWTSFVRAFAKESLQDHDAPDRTMVLEGKNTLYRLDNRKLRLKGLVVRRGATLLLCGDRPVIEAEYILVESGGLLQCGCEKTPYFGIQARITLRSNKLGYAKCGVVASEYSYKWYSPGAVMTHPATFTDITGSHHMFMNTFGPKSLGVGFCGNLVLVGSMRAGTHVPYMGTWDVKEGQTLFIDPTEHFLTHGDPDYDAAYAGTWGHLGENTGVKGDVFIHVDLGTVSGNAFEAWKQGSKIMITSVSQQYARGDSKPGTLGTPAMWMDYVPGTDNYNANLETIRALAPMHDIGMEVAEVVSVSSDGRVQLARPLHFHHAWRGTSPGGAFRAPITKDGRTLTVDTRPHVALLSRNILIEAQYENAPLSGGAFNLESKAPREENPNDYDFKGPGGHLVPNWSRFVAPHSYSSVSYGCYKDRDAALEEKNPNSASWQEARRYSKVGTGSFNDPAQYMNPEDVEPIGCWQLGTAGMKGANAILGSHTMFRYGSSSLLDGVELHRLGINSASGNIGAYCIHYHMAGWVSSFDEYLGPQAKREGTVRNCSIWQSASRVVSLHGSNEVQIKNNVSFLTYGSAWFTEEGNERLNVFEHNLCAATMLLRWSDFDNPSKLIASAGFDVNNASCFWIKNNQNAMVRNVACCCPRPVVGFWPIAQSIASGHNAASVCVGDPVRKLPSLAASWCASGGPAPDRFALGPSGYHAPCWAPESYYLKGRTTLQGCAAESNDNISAFYALSDNVAYSLLTFCNVYISFYACKPQPGPGDACTSLSIQARNTTEANAAVFLPFNAVSSCAEEALVSAYLQPLFTGSSEPKEKLFTPWSLAEELAFNGGIPGQCCRGACTGKSKGIVENTACSQCIPAMFASSLCFGTTGFVGQTGGALWSKSQSNLVVNCCFLQYGNSTALSGFESQFTSTSSVLAMGDNVNKYGLSYHIFYNHMCDGGTDLLPNPTVFAGPKTFLGDNFGWRQGEYVANRNVSVADLYLTDGVTLGTFPTSCWKNMSFMGGNNANLRIRLDNGAAFIVNFPGTSPKADGSWTRKPSLKNPFFMEIKDGKGRLLRYNASFSNFGEMGKFVTENPRWTIPADKSIGLFHTAMQIKLGDKLCEILAGVESVF